MTYSSGPKTRHRRVTVTNNLDKLLSTKKHIISFHYRSSKECLSLLPPKISLKRKATGTVLSSFKAHYFLSTFSCRIVLAVTYVVCLPEGSSIVDPHEVVSPGRAELPAIAWNHKKYETSICLNKVQLRKSRTGTSIRYRHPSSSIQYVLGLLLFLFKSSFLKTCIYSF